MDSRLAFGPQAQGTQPLFLGIQQHDGRATWVVKHNGDKDVRFPMGSEKTAVCLFVNAVIAANRSVNGARVELLHLDHVLMQTYVQDKARTRDFIDSMVVIMKSAI